MVPRAAARLLDLLIASAAMTLSSVFVMWNSLRLRRYPIQARKLPGRPRGRREGGTAATQRRGRCMLHLIHSAAMLYMFLALSAPAAGGGGMGGMGTGGSAMATPQYPTLAGAFTLLLIGYTIWDADQLSSRRFSLAFAGRPAIAAASGPRPAARAFLLARPGRWLAMSASWGLRRSARGGVSHR
jgi:hypothetical protein